MKNCDPLVSGPLFAIDTVPRLSVIIIEDQPTFTGVIT
jgi:hypothetical protein